MRAAAVVARLVGVLCVIAGVSVWSWPLGLVLAGVVLFVVGHEVAQ